MKKKTHAQIFGRTEVKVDLALERLLSEANIGDASEMVAACLVLEKLEMAEGCNFWETTAKDGIVTTHYMFIATEELIKTLNDNGTIMFDADTDS
jgi:hypothetical protein